MDACTELDAIKAGNSQLIWEGVQEAFSGQDEAHHNLYFSDGDVLGAVHYVNFKIIVPHDWQKIRALWKHLIPGYKAVLNHFIMSGTHSSNFFEFWSS